VYFEPDTDVLIESSRSVLDSIGRQLAANPGVRLLLRAYTAYFGTANGRFLVSTARASFCQDYLTQRFGISAGRISSEAWGSERTPLTAGPEWSSYRCVEFFFMNE
jgi:outer membrane protein OmpA-like peptidoglycan-associated protein